MSCTYHTCISKSRDPDSDVGCRLFRAGAQMLSAYSVLIKQSMTCSNKFAITVCVSVVVSV